MIEELPGIPYVPYPIAFRTADILPFYFDEDQVPHFLVGKKHKESKWRLIGGFVDPTDNDGEHGAHRELGEEAHAFISLLKYQPFLPNPFTSIKTVADWSKHLHALNYMGSFKVKDTRYAKVDHKIITSAYIVMVQSTEIDKFAPGDDIKEITWKTTEEMKNLDDFETCHHPIITAIIERCQL